MLREIASLFIVKQDNLSVMIQQGYLSRLDPAFLHPYLMMRGDASQLSRILKELAGNKAIY